MVKLLNLIIITARNGLDLIVMQIIQISVLLINNMNKVINNYSLALYPLTIAILKHSERKHSNKVRKTIHHNQTR